MDAGRGRCAGRDMGVGMRNDGCHQHQGQGPEQPYSKGEDGVEREETEVQLDSFGMLFPATFIQTVLRESLKI